MKFVYKCAYFVCVRWLTVPISRKAIPQNNKYNVQHFLDAEQISSYLYETDENDHYFS